MLYIFIKSKQTSSKEFNKKIRLTVLSDGLRYLFFNVKKVISTGSRNRTEVQIRDATGRRISSKIQIYSK